MATEFYKGVVGWADAARLRAQGANGIASAIALALIGTAVLGKLDQQPTWIRVIGVVSVLCWMVAAGLFVYATAVSADVRQEAAARIQEDSIREGAYSAREVVGSDAFVAQVLKRVQTERDTVEGRSRWAMGASGVAALLTLATLAAIVFEPPELVNGEIVVTDGEASAAQMVCPTATSHITGRLLASSLNSEFVTILPNAASCGDHGAVLRIPRAGILAEKATAVEDDIWPIP